MGIETCDCMERFIRCCTDGWEQGWHERNGGNLSYRMTDADVCACKPFFNAESGPWVPLGVTARNLAGAFFIVTGTGRYMRNVALAPAHNLAILEIDSEGSAYRLMWGLEGGGKPTSEFPTHVMNHSIRMTETDEADRVIYHSHAPNIITLSTLIEPDSRRFTRVLWKSMTECVIIFPEGVGVVPWMIPGGAAIAQATCELMHTHSCVVWMQHGLFCSGSGFDEAFGLMHTVEKSAWLYLQARAANGGAEPEYLIGDDQLAAVAKAYGVEPNGDFLDV